jgi:hypothetical protein
MAFALRINPSDLRPTVRVVLDFIISIASVLAGTYAFLYGLRELRLSRYLRNVPRSKIRSAAIGPVELCGTAVGPYTVVPPNESLECLSYWRVTEAKTVQFISAPLYLDDGTGTVMVAPRDLDMSLIPSLLEPGIYGVVCPGQTIFVLGSLQENPWTKEKDNPNRDELSRIGPGFVSEAEADVLRTSASPLYYPSGGQDNSDRVFDMFPPTVLMKGKGPFVISEKSQRDVLAELKTKMYGGVWGGPVLALLGITMLVVFGSGWWRELFN